MYNVQEVIDSIQKSLSQHSISRKDEVSVMQNFMNDTTYEAKMYNKQGEVESYYPGQDFKRMIGSTISSIAHIPIKEASELVDNHEFTKADAATMVNFSKEFMHSYLQTGRKIALGPKETSNVEMFWKHIPEHTVNVPSRNESAERTQKTIPAYDGIRVINKCPQWWNK